MIALGLLNVIFGRIIVTLGSHYQSSNHQEVLEQIAPPVINRIIDVTLIISCFVVGFVMVAGAGPIYSSSSGCPAGQEFCSAPC